MCLPGTRELTTPREVLGNLASEVRTCTRPQQSPSGQYFRCGSRHVSRCPGCARLYIRDQRAIGRSGFSPIAVGSSADLTKFGFYFVTLTAPSFGRTRQDLIGPNGQAVPGVPVIPKSYDYAGQVAWNGASGRLWTKTVQRLRRDLECKDIEFFGVWEMQARGARHLHVIVRMPTTPGFTSALTVKAMRSSFSRVATGSHKWGAQMDVTVLATSDPEGDSEMVGEKSFRHAYAYITKSLAYSLKDLGAGTGEGLSVHPLLRDHLGRLEKHSRTFGLSKSAHWVTKSRKWSLTGLTRNQQRENRAEWAAEQTAGVIEEAEKVVREAVGDQRDFTSEIDFDEAGSEKVTVIDSDSGEVLAREYTTRTVETMSTTAQQVWDRAVVDFINSCRGGLPPDFSKRLLILHLNRPHTSLL